MNSRRRAARRNDYGYLAADQFGRERWQPIELTLGPAVFDPESA
jgi:hypothetical protein